MSNSIGEHFKDILDLSSEQVVKIDELFKGYMRSLTFLQKSTSGESQHKFYYIRKTLSLLSEQQKVELTKFRKQQRLKKKEKLQRRKERTFNQVKIRFKSLGLSEAEINKTIAISETVKNEWILKRKEQVLKNIPFDAEEFRRKRTQELMSAFLSEEQQVKLEVQIIEEKKNWDEYQKQRIKQKFSTLDLSDDQLCKVLAYDHQISIDYHLERNKSQLEKDDQRAKFMRGILDENQLAIFQKDEKAYKEHSEKKRLENNKKSELRYASKVEEEKERIDFIRKYILPKKVELAKKLHSSLSKTERDLRNDLRIKFERNLKERVLKSQGIVLKEYGLECKNMLLHSALQSSMLAYSPSPILFDPDFDMENDFPFSDQILLSNEEKKILNGLDDKYLKYLMHQFEASGNSYLGVSWFSKQNPKPKYAYEYSLLLLEDTLEKNDEYRDMIFALFMRA